MKDDKKSAPRAGAIQAMEEELHRKEEELQAHYIQMGKSLLELADGEQRTIDHLVDDIIATRTRLAEARDERRCPACCLFNTADSRFCKHCGAKLTPPTENTEKKE